MIKKISIGVATSALIASTLLISGCGTSEVETPAGTGSSSSTTFNTSSEFSFGNVSSASSTPTSSSSTSTTTSTSSQAATSTGASSSAGDSTANATSVLISDAYVLNATVKMGGVEANIEVGEGSYEWTTATSGAFEVAIRATNDLNGNKIADAADAYAPALKAPAGYSNINPFTTMIVNGMSTAEIKALYPVADGIATVLLTGTAGIYDFDVVLRSQSNLDFAKEILKAALTLATEQTAAASAPNFRVCVASLLPGEATDSVTGEPCTLSGTVQSSSSSSSSSPAMAFDAAVNAATTADEVRDVAKAQFDSILGAYVVPAK